MGHHDDQSFLGHSAKQGKDVTGIFLIQGSRGFVGQDDLGIGSQASSQRNALLFSAGKSIGTNAGFLVHPEEREQVVSLLFLQEAAIPIKRIEDEQDVVFRGF